MTTKNIILTPNLATLAYLQMKILVYQTPNLSHLYYTILMMSQHRGDLPKPLPTAGGTPTSKAFENAVASLYKADICISTCSGLSAISTAILSVVKSGEHALFPDSLYGSSRHFVEHY